MSLVTRSRKLALTEYMTLEQASLAKGTNYDALRMWLRLHPGVETQRIGRSVGLRWGPETRSRATGSTSTRA